jgi:hypothetical protein
MTEITHLKNILRKKRRYASFFEWPVKHLKELGIVEELFKSMSVLNDSSYHSPCMGPSPNDAPDCVSRSADGSLGLVPERPQFSMSVRRTIKGKYFKHV